MNWINCRFLPGNVNYTLVINMDTNSMQNVRLSDQMPNLYGSLTVVIGSKNSNLDSGWVIIISRKLFRWLGLIISCMTDIIQKLRVLISICMLLKVRKFIFKKFHWRYSWKLLKFTNLNCFLNTCYLVLKNESFSN